VLAWRVLGWRIVAWHVTSGWHRAQVWWQLLAVGGLRAWRSALARHPALRFLQILPIALLLWVLDDAASFRAGAAVAGMRRAIAVNSVSLQIGGGFVPAMNDWLTTHHAAALAATWYYILLQGALTGVVGALLLWRRVPRFGLYRNSLIAITALGLVAFWCYPVAPPRLLQGYHDVIASAVPTFANAVEPAGSATYAALPSLHVAWALWTTFACMALVRRPILRAALWLYPVATIVDVTATANHYLLDVITALRLLLLGYLLALTPGLARTHLAGRRRAAAGVHGAVLTCAIPAPDAAPANADGSRRR
jgi:PAP2 superfamily